MNQKEILDCVLEHYNLGKLKAFKIVKGGYINLNFQIFTEKGIYFLREYKHLFNVKKIKHLNKLLLKLKEQNFLVAKPILTKKGDTVVEVEGKGFSIAEYIEGEKYNFSEQHFLNAAKTLAHLHKSVKSIPTKNGTIVSCHNTKHIKALFKGHNSLHYKIQEKKQKTSFDLYLINSINRFEKHFYIFEKDIPYVRNRDNLSIIHGDFWHGQLIFNENEVAALIDFDEIKIGSTEYDLVKGIRSFPRFHNKIGYNLKKLGKFLNSYKQVFEEIDIEPREVLAFLRHALLEILEYHIRVRAFEKEDKDASREINYHLDELDWIEKHEDEIIHEFMK